MVEIVIECEVCGKGCVDGEEELATFEHEGEEFCIQSEDGGFVCKECWDKFMKFCSKMVLCGPDPLDEPDLDDIEIALDRSEEEAIIDSVILEAAIKDGTAHYSTDDGHQFIITHIGMGKRYPTEKPDTGTSFHGGVTSAKVEYDEITRKAGISMKRSLDDPDVIIHHHDWPKGDDEDDACQICGMIRWEDQLHKEAYELAFRNGYNTRMAEEIEEGEWPHGICGHPSFLNWKCTGPGKCSQFVGINGVCQYRAGSSPDSNSRDHGPKCECSKCRVIVEE